MAPTRAQWRISRPAGKRTALIAKNDATRIGKKAGYIQNDVILRRGKAIPRHAELFGQHQISECIEGRECQDKENHQRAVQGQEREVKFRRHDTA